MTDLYAHPLSDIHDVLITCKTISKFMSRLNVRWVDLATFLSEFYVHVKDNESRPLTGQDLLNMTPDQATKLFPTIYTAKVNKTKNPYAIDTLKSLHRMVREGLNIRECATALSTGTISVSVNQLKMIMGQYNFLAGNGKEFRLDFGILRHCDEALLRSSFPEQYDQALRKECKKLENYSLAEIHNLIQTTRPISNISVLFGFTCNSVVENYLSRFSYFDNKIMKIKLLSIQFFLEESTENAEIIWGENYRKASIINAYAHRSAFAMFNSNQTRQNNPTIVEPFYRIQTSPRVGPSTRVGLSPRVELSPGVGPSTGVGPSPRVELSPDAPTISNAFLEPFFDFDVDLTAPQSFFYLATTDASIPAHQDKKLKLDKKTDKNDVDDFCQDVFGV
ncbi:MAG: hypothetical protein ACHP6H_01895 [Legionellales bacterium]